MILREVEKSDPDSPGQLNNTSAGSIRAGVRPDFVCAHTPWRCDRGFKRWRGSRCCCHA